MSSKARIIFHIIPGFITLALYRLGSPLWFPFLLLIPGLALASFLDLARKFNPELGKSLLKPLPEGFLRPHEVNAMSGSFWYLVGVESVLLAGFLLAPGSERARNLVCLAILFLAWVDPVAAMVGRRWGKHRPAIMQGKSLEGSAAALVTGMLITRWFLHSSSWITCFHGGVIASFSEAFGFAGLDDNLVIPVLSAALLAIFV